MVGGSCHALVPFYLDDHVEHSCIVQCGWIVEVHFSF